MARWKVNIQLLPVKAHYFFYCAAAAALVPFLPVLGKQLGVSEIEIGIIYALAPVLGIIAKPTVGMLADRMKKRKNFLLFFILLALMTSLCIALIPQSEPMHPVHFECGANGLNYIRQSTVGRRDLSCESEATWKEKLIQENQQHNVTFTQDGQILGDGLESCQIRCEIHGYLEGIEFCKNLIVPTKPKMCDLGTLPLPMSSDLITSNDSEVESETITTTTEKSRRTFVSLPPNPSSWSDDHDEHFRGEPYQLKFDALLKIAHAEMLDDDFFLPIAQVKFEGSPKFQKFTCLPKEVVLEACYINCSSNAALNSHMERVLSEPESFQSSTFWLFGILVVTSTVAMAVVNSLSDALCFQLLGNKPHYYGRQRLLAAVGWGGSTLIAGYLIDRSSQSQLTVKDYTPCFYMLGGLFVLDLIMSYKWEIKEVDKPKSLMDNMCTLVSDLQIIIFFFACVLVGMCTGIHWYFLFLLLEEVAMESTDYCDTMQWLKLLQGLMVAVQCLSEIPFFYYSGWFIKKIGTVHCLSLVLLAFGVRLLIYSFLVHPWAFVPVELFQGITFGLFYSVMATYADEISPKGSQATVQGIVGAGFEGLGIASGSLVAGVLFKTVGGKMAYRVFGFGAIVFCGLHAFLTHFLRKKRIYGIPISDTEPEGQEMCKINGVSHDVETESE